MIINKRWDQFFLGMAEYTATASRDPSTKVGAVIVRPNKTVASIGFNGFARGVKDDVDRYIDRSIKYEMIVHAELNAILSAVGNVDGCYIYVSPLHPCPACASAIVQAGIKKVGFRGGDTPDRWKDRFAIAATILAEAGVEVHSVL